MVHMAIQKTTKNSSFAKLEQAQDVKLVDPVFSLLNADCVCLKDQVRSIPFFPNPFLSLTMHPTLC